MKEHTKRLLLNIWPNAKEARTSKAWPPERPKNMATVCPTCQFVLGDYQCCPVCKTSAPIKQDKT